jgi:hypothetical protein
MPITFSILNLVTPAILHVMLSISLHSVVCSPLLCPHSEFHNCVAILRQNLS